MILHLWNIGDNFKSHSTAWNRTSMWHLFEETLSKTLEKNKIEDMASISKTWVFINKRGSIKDTLFTLAKKEMNIICNLSQNPNHCM